MPPVLLSFSDSFNLAIEILLFSGGTAAGVGGATTSGFNLAIEILLFSGSLNLRRCNRRSLVLCFNLAIEILLLSGISGVQDNTKLLQRFNLAIEILLFSGLRGRACSKSAAAQFQSRNRDTSLFRVRCLHSLRNPSIRFNLATEILLFSGMGFRAVPIGIVKSFNLAIEILLFSGIHAEVRLVQDIDCVSISQSRYFSFQDTFTLRVY